MRLRSQLGLVVGLAAVVLPATAWWLVIQLETAMREQQARALAAYTEIAASRLALDAQLAEHGWYIHRARAATVLDGYLDDGMDRAPEHRFGDDRTLSVRLSHFADALTIHLHIEDRSVVVADRLRLALDDQILDLQLDGDGSITDMQRFGRGQMRAVEPGYQVELVLRADQQLERLGVMSLDYAGQPPVFQTAVGTAINQRYSAWPLIDIEELETGLTMLDSPYALSLYSREGMPLTSRAAQTDVELPWRGLRLLLTRLANITTVDPSPDDATTRLLASAAAGEQAVLWSRDGSGLGSQLMAGAPVLSADGKWAATLLVVVSGDALLTVVSGTLLRGFALAFLGVGLIALAALVLAIRLSRRVMRLTAQADRARRGQSPLAAEFQPDTGSDELGELSRHYLQLLQHADAQHEYVRNLATTLSHELKTPLAISRSSLEMLDHHIESEDGVEYLQRAQTGIDRLRRMLQAMSAANRFEDSLQEFDAQETDIGALVTGLAEAMTAGRPELTIVVDQPDHEVRAHAFPELLVQAIEKLVDNAISFAPAGARICCRVSQHDGEVTIGVANEGSTISSALRAQVFAPMIKLRANESDHLGLGLFVVHLVARHHGGKTYVRDAFNGRGIEIGFTWTAL